MLAIATLAFDIAALEIFLPLVPGRATIAPSKTAMDAGALIGLIKRSGATSFRRRPPRCGCCWTQAGPALDSKGVCGGEAWTAVWRASCCRDAVRSGTCMGRRKRRCGRPSERWKPVGRSRSGSRSQKLGSMSWTARASSFRRESSASFISAGPAWRADIFVGRNSLRRILRSRSVLGATWRANVSHRRPGATADGWIDRISRTYRSSSENSWPPYRAGGNRGGPRTSSERGASRGGRARGVARRHSPCRLHHS